MLLTSKEQKQWEKRFKVAETKIQQCQKNRLTADWDSAWAYRGAVRRAFQAFKAQKVQENPQPFLSGLLALVGDPSYQMLLDELYPKPPVGVVKFDTPENRRILWTILKALAETPKTWARSAVVRHLRGTGKQKTTPYTGNGVFGAKSSIGWKEVRLQNVVMTLMGGYYGEGDIGNALLWYDPDLNCYPGDEHWDAANETGSNPFAMTTNIARDKDFIVGVLCKELEDRGLAPELTRAW